MSVIQIFLGNHKADNYQELVHNMQKYFEKVAANMSIIVHFLYSHLDHFPSNLGNSSEEQGERFHQDIQVMEEKNQGRWDIHRMETKENPTKNGSHSFLTLMYVIVPCLFRTFYKSNLIRIKKNQDKGISQKLEPIENEAWHIHDQN